MNHTRASQEQFFRELYQKHAGTPMAVSSESLAHKHLRYSQISKIFRGDDQFSIHDVGMGLADYLHYLRKHFSYLSFEYSGTEILREYFEEASRLYPGNKFFLRDIAVSSFPERYDYVVMSGVFHQRRDIRIRDWEDFSQKLISNAFTMCRKAIAFNFVSPFVDFYQPGVYYSNLPKLLNFINDKLSRFFTIHHNYALYEFTVFVYRPEYLIPTFPQPEFQKYFYSVNA